MVGGRMPTSKSAITSKFAFTSGIGLASAFVLATGIGCCTAGAQGMAGMPGMADMAPVIAPEQLPAPVKMTGIGNSHITIKASAEAQAWFDQGLSLLHDFWDYESAKAFEQAIRVAPCAGGGWQRRWGCAATRGMPCMGRRRWPKR